MKIYGDVGYAYYDLVDNKFENEEQRNLILKYIFTSYTYSFKALKSGCLQGDEIQKAIDICLTSLDSSLNLLKFKPDILSEKQLQTAIERLLSYWTTSFELLNSFESLLTEEQKNRAFEMVMLNEHTIIKGMSTNIFNKEQRSFILNNLSDIKNVCFTILEYHPELEEERKLSFEHVINFKGDLYKLAKKNKLNNKEKEKIYQLYRKYYYDNSKYKTKEYYDYCCVFQDFLNDHEHKLLIRKAIREKNSKFANNILSNIKLPDIYKDQLEGAIIAHKLSGKY